MNGISAITIGLIFLILIVWIFVFIIYYTWGTTGSYVLLAFTILLILLFIIAIIAFEFFFPPAFAVVTPVTPPVVPPPIPTPSGPVKVGDVLAIVANLSAVPCNPNSGTPGSTVFVTGQPVGSPIVRNWRINVPGATVGTSISYGQTITLTNVNTAFPTTAMSVNSTFQVILPTTPGATALSLTINKSTTTATSNSFVSYGDTVTLTSILSAPMVPPSPFQMIINNNDMAGTCGPRVDMIHSGEAFTGFAIWVFT